MKEIYFITDLDRTLIHAKNKGHKCVEYIEKSEITYMTQKSYDAFLELLKIKEFNFIPCTMRNINQTLRVNFIKDYNPKIIICTNGAQIYIDGKLDDAWNIKMKSLIDEESIEENIRFIKSLNLNYQEVRNIEDFYITIKCENQDIAFEVFNNLKDKFKANIKVIHIAKKIFIIDERIDKIYAVDYIVNKYKIKNFVTAGDSKVDENFTKRGRAIIPKHASFTHNNAIVTQKEGIESTEDIIEYLQREFIGI